MIAIKIFFGWANLLPLVSRGVASQISTVVRAQRMAVWSQKRRFELMKKMDITLTNKRSIGHVEIAIIWRNIFPPWDFTNSPPNKEIIQWVDTDKNEARTGDSNKNERERERARNLSTSGAQLSSKERGKKCLGFHQPSLLASNLFYHDSAFSRDWFSGEPIDDKWTTYGKPHLTATNRFR